VAETPRTATDLEFTPVGTLAALFSADPELHRFIFLLGPIGSTKTTTALFFLLMTAARQAPSPDGYRRTRFALVRSTVTSLMNTVLKDILNLFGGIADWQPSKRMVTIEVGDIRSEWMLMPLDTPEDQKRLLSLQLSAVFINEAREIAWDLLQQIFTRTGRYPSDMAGGVECTHRFLIADSNLGVEDSDMYKFLEEKRSPRTLYIHQPSAVSPEADWLRFLPEGYYSDAMDGASEQWIRQHVFSQWGRDLSGEPVYGSSFVTRWHVAPDRVKSFPDRPLILGIDPGLNPAVVVAQVAPNGQLRVLREFHAPNILFRDFLNRFVIPELQMLYPLHNMIWVMDPAGSSHTALSADTAVGVLKGYNFEVVLAHTNELLPRIRAVERYLLTTTSGGVLPDEPGAANGPAGVEPPAAPFEQGVPVNPGFLVDPTCKALVKGFEGAYRYVRDKKGTGELNPKPEKKHPTSDVHDCLQYVCMALTGRRVGRATRTAPNYDGMGPAAYPRAEAPRWRGR
jgi:hypothetical protein